MTRGWARVAVAAALVVLALTIAGSIAAPPPPPCGGLDPSYQPILAFELARSGDDLRALFGAGPSPCRTAMIDAMDTVNVVDLALFIPAYTLFLVASFLGLRPRAPGLARAGIAIAGLAALGDVAENVCLFGLTPAIDPASPWLARLPWVTAVKWLALGGAGAIAALVLRRGGRASKVGAAVCLLAPIATIAAIAAPAQLGPVIAAGVAASWAVLAVVAVASARRR